MRPGVREELNNTYETWGKTRSGVACNLCLYSLQEMVRSPELNLAVIHLMCCPVHSVCSSGMYDILAASPSFGKLKRCISSDASLPAFWEHANRHINWMQMKLITCMQISAEMVDNNMLRKESITWNRI